MAKFIAAFYDPVTLVQDCLVITTDGPKALDAHAPKGMVRVDIPEAVYNAKDAAALSKIAPSAVVQQVFAMKASVDAKIASLITDAAPVNGNATKK